MSKLGRAYRSVRHRLEKRPESGVMAVRDRFSDLAKHAPENPVFVDGGANEGAVTQQALECFDSPTIHAVEPIPELAEGLRDRFSDNPMVHVHEVALGNERSTETFRVARNASTSSFFEPTEQAETWNEGYYDTAKEVDVEVVRLDDLVPDVDVIKLDLQGFELEALRGATECFPGVSAILSEVEFVELYDGQPLFSDVTQFLESRDFRVFNLYELYTHESGQLSVADALYVQS